MKSVGICKFCNEVKPLCEAHIIPKWCYKLLHPSGKIGQEPLIMVSLDQSKKQKSWHGRYDPNILCNVCDGIFGDYDDYASRTLTTDNLLSYYSKNDRSVYTFKSNQFPNKLRLFFLSVLYRMSICTLKDYSYLQLPNNISKELKTILKNKSSVPNDFYPFIISKYLEDPNGFSSKLLLIPYVQSIKGEKYIHISLGNSFNAMIKLDKKTTKSIFEGLTLKELPYYVISYQTIHQHPYFKQMVQLVQTTE